MTSPPIDIVTSFTTLLQDQQKHQAALDMLDDDFQFKTPNTSQFVTGKDKWYQGFSTSKINPTFDPPELSTADGKQVVTRKGKVKKAMLTFHIMETFEVNDSGMITKLVVARA